MAEPLRDTPGDPVNASVHVTPSGNRVPYVSDAAKQFLAESESLEEELFDLASIFRVPVTNNIEWFEDGDELRPVYHVGEFITAIKAAFEHEQEREKARERLKDV